MGLTKAQRYNRNMEKIFQEARANGALSEWRCNKINSGNNDWECESKGGNAVSMSSDGSIRFTKFNCNKDVRVDGKSQRGKCGVEID